MSGGGLRTSEQPTNNTPLQTSTTTAVVEGNNSPSSPEKIHKSGNNPELTTNNHQWNGDPMDWETWPNGRPGPSLSESRTGQNVEALRFFEQTRDEQSRMEEKVFHLAEFSSTGRGESSLSLLV